MSEEYGTTQVGKVNLDVFVPGFFSHLLGFANGGRVMGKDRPGVAGRRCGVPKEGIRWQAQEDRPATAEPREEGLVADHGEGVCWIQVHRDDPQYGHGAQTREDRGLGRGVLREGQGREPVYDRDRGAWSAEREARDQGEE